MENINPDDYMTTAEFAEKYDISQGRVRQLVDEGQIKSRRFFGCVLIPKTEKWDKHPIGYPKGMKRKPRTAPPGYISANDYADKLGVSRGRVRQFISRGQLEQKWWKIENRSYWIRQDAPDIRKPVGRPWHKKDR